MNLINVVFPTEGLGPHWTVMWPTTHLGGAGQKIEFSALMGSHTVPLCVSSFSERVVHTNFGNFPEASSWVAYILQKALLPFVCVFLWRLR